MEVQVNASAEKSESRIGWGLLALALAIPALMGAAGLMSAFKVGELTFQVGFAWLVVALASDFLLRKRGPSTKAKGRIVAAALALVMGLTTGIGKYLDTQKVDSAKKELIEQFMASIVEAQKSATQPASPDDPTPIVSTAVTEEPNPAAAPAAPTPVAGSEADRVVAVLGQMTAQAKKFTGEFAALNRKFTANDLSDALKAENLVSRTGIQASREKAENIKMLISQRNVILQRHYDSTEAIIRNSGLSQMEISNALAGSEAGKGNAPKNYRELGEAQLASLKLIVGLLNFAEKNLGRITAQNGQIMFQAQPELDEYQRLMAALTESSAREDAIAQRVQAEAQQHKQNIVDEYKK